MAVILTGLKHLARRVPRQVRVIAVTLVVFGLGVAFGVPFVDDPQPLLGPEIPWWALTLLFALAEVCVLHLQVRREAQTISLSEIPLTLGLFFCAPAAFLAARVVGPVLVFAFYRRQAPIKLFYNSSLLFAEAAVALTVFHLIAGGEGVVGPQEWIAAFVAAGVAGGLLSGVATATVITVYESKLNVWPLVRATIRAVPFAMVVATLGLVGVHALDSDASSAWLLGLTVAILFGAYRVYARLAERHVALEQLYGFSQAVTSTPDVRNTLDTVLLRARELLKAEEAELMLLDGSGCIAVRLHESDEGSSSPSPTDAEDDLDWMLEMLAGVEMPVVLTQRGRQIDAHRFLQQRRLREAIVAPLRGDGALLGILLVSNRLGDVRTFDESDARLLATVANQASVALRKGQLIDELRHEALHDALTGLPNRAALQNTIRASLDNLSASRREVAVMIMDLDRFKDVNDTLGHQHGDLLLREITARIGSTVGNDAFVGRLGGDEFGIVVQGTRSVARSLEIAHRILAVVRDPFALDGVEVECNASIGVALAPAHGRTVSELLRRADLAMYRAKASGDGVKIYDEEWGEGDPDHLLRVAELRAAIPGGELRLCVQPKVSLATGRVEGVEALVRWQHPTLGLLAPSEFVPTAERSGSIRPLTGWVVREAIDAARAWRATGIDVGIAVNLSPCSLTDRTLADEIIDFVHDGGVPVALTLEITESGVLTDPDRALALLEAFRRAGIKLSLDDFGTGYSSLSYLKRLPVSEVKIDRTFVGGLKESGSAAIVRAIAELGRGLGLEIVAEGVESQATLDALADFGVDSAQGYYIAPPLLAEDFKDWLLKYEDGDGRRIARRATAMAA